MKIKDLKNYGIPSSILNIWEKNPSPYLLPLQEDAVRNYGILSCGEDKEGRMQYAPTGRMDSRFRGNDIKRNGNDPSEVRLHGASRVIISLILILILIFNLNLC